MGIYKGGENSSQIGEVSRKGFNKQVALKLILKDVQKFSRCKGGYAGDMEHMIKQRRRPKL